MQFFKRHGLGQEHWAAPPDIDVDDEGYYDEAPYDSADESAEAQEDSQQPGLTKRAGAAAVQKAAEQPGSSVHVSLPWWPCLVLVV